MTLRCQWRHRSIAPPQLQPSSTIKNEYTGVLGPFQHIFDFRRADSLLFLRGHREGDGPLASGQKQSAAAVGQILAHLVQSGALLRLHVPYAALHNAAHHPPDIRPLSLHQRATDIFIYLLHFDHAVQPAQQGRPLIRPSQPKGSLGKSAQ